MNCKHPNNDTEFRVSVAALGIVLVAVAGLIAIHFVNPQMDELTRQTIYGVAMSVVFIAFLIGIAAAIGIGKG